MFNFIWKNIGGTALIACKTPTNVISSVLLPEHIYFNEAFFIAWTRSSSNIGKIEARENLNHDEYMEEEYYYNVDWLTGRD